jgi:beta-glucanase (GH16 family)
MGRRIAVIVAALILLAVVLVADPGGRSPGGSPPAFGTEPSSSLGGAGSAPGSVGPSSSYPFDDEFDGPALAPVWQRHFSCCGDLAGFDPGLTTEANGILSIAVDHRADGWYGDLIDTKTTWSQLYGTFEARIRVPSGQGLWPAFWSYFSGHGTQAEIDTMEICGGPPGATGSTVLHNTVYWSQTGSLGHDTPTGDLSADFHVFAMDWRRDRIVFSLDGTPVWTFSDVDHIPTVPLPVILDLGVGGSFCGAPDSTTPATARMLVDWVRVLP